MGHQTSGQSQTQLSREDNRVSHMSGACNHNSIAGLIYFIGKFGVNVFPLWGWSLKGPAQP